VIGLLLLAFALRTHMLGMQELGFDEVASFYIAAQGPAGLISYVRSAIREHPPFYYLLLSLWMSWAGVSEFAIRSLSVGIGLATVAVAYRLVKQATRPFLALLMTLLLALSPFHIQESRDARMYGLLALCSLLSIFFFIRLLTRDRARWWGLFWLVTGLGMLTHYYMAFVLLAEDLFLLLNWRRYRHIWPRWLAVHAVVGGGLAMWVILSPGLSSTLLSFWERGAASRVRWNALARALGGLYLGTEVRLNWLRLGVPLLLTGLGVGAAQRPNAWLPRGHRHGGLLLGLLIGVPLVAVLALPERVTGRYLTAVLPSCILAMALALEWLADTFSRLSPEGRAVRLLAWMMLLLLIIFLDVSSYPLLYAVPSDGFRARTEYLQVHAQPADGFLLHGPWQWLLPVYYDPGPVSYYTTPLKGQRTDVALVQEGLARLFESRSRIWVSYDSVDPVDPDWAVARWLYEHTHRVWSKGNLVLYYAAPQEPLPTLAERVRFEGHLQLETVEIANTEPVSGEAILLRTEWRALQDIDHRLILRLELDDPEGQVWGVHEFHAGPFHTPTDRWTAYETFTEQCGLIIPVGTPPGDYTLRLHVFSPEGEWLPEGEEQALGVGLVRVGHSTPTEEELEALPGHELRATFGDALALIGYEPGGLRFTQGNPALFSVYWQALATSSETYELDISLTADDGTVLVEERKPVIASWCPPESWLAGDVLLGYYVLSLPLDAPPGNYQILLTVRAADGTPLSAEGTRSYRVLDWWPREQRLSGTEIALFGIEVEERPRLYRPPAMQHQVDVVLGEDVRLLGYDLASARVRPGDAVELTLYWQALRRMEDTYYAVFNHLTDSEGTTVAQADGWPRGGTYPTLQWLPGEVVDDSYTIPIPSGLPPGEYTLLVGMYDAANGNRPVTVVDGNSIAERHIVLTVIAVEE
jgi:hypothetical protein